MLLHPMSGEWGKARPRRLRERLPARPGAGRPGPTEPTPGERLLYALGQLHRQWRARATLTPPAEVDVEAVAKMLGVWGEVEFVQDEDGGVEPSRHLHFADEVLVIDPRCGFPWHLFDVWEWARWQEAREFWRYFD